MTYYLMIEDGEIIGAGQCPCASDDVINYKVSEKIYNNFCEDKDRYIWNGKAVVVNPDYDEIKERERREYLSRLAMTKLDFFKYVCKPNNITYAMLMEMVQSNEDILSAWELCGHVFRGDEILCTYITQFLPAMTSDVLDAIFEQYGKVIND